MANVTFGNYPVNMDAPDLGSPLLAAVENDTAVFLLLFSSTLLRFQFSPSGVKLELTGKFISPGIDPLTGAPLISPSSTVSGFVYTGPTAEPIVSVTGLPPTSVRLSECSSSPHLCCERRDRRDERAAPATRPLAADT